MNGRRFGWVGVWAVGLLCSAVALGAERVVSPDGRTAADFELKSGVPTVRVTYDGAAAFEATVGLVPGRFDLLNVRRRTVDASWKPVWGFRSSYPERYGELSVELAQRKGGRPVARLTLRAYDEGFAVRSESGLEVYALGSVEREATEFRFPSGAAAWCIAGTEATFDANPTRLEALDAAKNWRMPFTLRIPGCGYASIFEADVRGAPRSWLKAEKGALRPVWAVGTMEGRGWCASPWRAVALGKAAVDLVARAYFIENLNAPCALAGTDWIRPGLSVCDMGVATLKTSDMLAAIPALRAVGARYGQVDWGWYGTEYAWSDADRAAFERGHPELKDVLADGRWRANTRSDGLTVASGFVPYHPWWPYNCHRRDVDFDPKAVAAELRKHGMGLCLYVHGDVLEKSDLDRLFATYESWGIAGLKPGFVGYGSQRATDFLRRLAETAARHHLWLDIHDAHIPDGFERTYPNVMITEGGGGEEGNHPVRQDVVLPFTRCLAGPFDYTPRFFNRFRTHAHAAAMLLVYPGPTAVMRGSPAQAAAAEPSLFAGFVKALPFDYDETRVLAGEIGRHLTVARRRGATWYLAGLSGEEAMEFSHTFDFLGNGTYTLKLWRDADDNPAHATHFETRTVTARDGLSVRLAPGGGFCAVLAP